MLLTVESVTKMTYHSICLFDCAQHSSCCDFFSLSTYLTYNLLSFPDSYSEQSFLLGYTVQICTTAVSGDCANYVWRVVFISAYKLCC